MEQGLQNLIASIPLLPATSDAHFSVRPIPGFEQHYVGYDAQGCPSVLLSSSDDSFRAPLTLSGLSVSYCIPCRFTLPNHQTVEQPLTQLICTSQSGSERDYFLHIASTIVELVGTAPSTGQIAEAVNRLVDILQRLSRPPTRTLVGLYGEMLFLQQSSQPDYAVQAWRSETDDRFDFSIDDIRLDVKSTSLRQRTHSFSLEQCLPVPGATTIVVSIFVESSGGGKSLRDLVQALLDRLTTAEARFRVQHIVAETLGSALLPSLNARFDDLLGLESLRFFDSSDIPAIRPPVPQHVTAVKFQSDLTYVVPLDPDELSRASQAWQSLTPRRP